jgi:titin
MKALMGFVAILTFGPISLLQFSTIRPFENFSPDPPTKATSPVEVAFFVTLTVNSKDDVVDGAGCDATHCSLREAIVASNTSVGTVDVIEFDIPGAGPHTIQPNSALPTITDPVTIDGYTQSGASVNTNGPGLGSNAVLKIELDGSSAGGGADGLQISASNSTVQGLVINRFAVSGVLISDPATGNVIQGNFIGTDVMGTAALGNGLHGVSIVRAPGNTIGGTTSAARNVISGNSVFGVGVIFSGATGNLVQGNLIGTDVAGTAAIGNGNSGVDLNDAPNNTVGGTGAGARNVISGNNIDGVLLRNGASGSVVQGNYIGTDVTGTAPLGNADRGVHILLDANSNTIGGTTAAGNVISGNNAEGVKITGFGAIGNLVQGNLVGTDLNGTTALPNGASGVLIDGARNNTIGWTASGAGNVISGNSDGVVIMGVNGTGNRVVGNHIGTDMDGTAVVPNTSVAGVHIDGAPDNEIGGTLVEERNILSGNGDGIFINGAAATGNVVRGNYIGTDATGTVALGNDGQGVFISAPDNTVGGTTTGAGNVISGNAEAGIRISDAGATGNVVEGNYIGTDATGALDLGNDQDGISVNTDASDNTIGGLGSGEGNTIAFNGGDGVFVESGTGNAVLSNSIHSNGGLGIDLGSNDVDVNDDGDGDAGANGLQNFPVVTSVIAGSTFRS